MCTSGCPRAPRERQEPVGVYRLLYAPRHDWGQDLADTGTTKPEKEKGETTRLKKDHYGKGPAHILCGSLTREPKPMQEMLGLLIRNKA